MGLNKYAQYKDENVWLRGQYNPGLFALNKKKLKQLRPELFGLRLIHSKLDTWQSIYSSLHDGDTQPCVVVSLEPCLVACYSDEFDGVAMLWFPDQLAGAQGWQLGTRLLSTNLYGHKLTPVPKNKDLDPGPRADTGYKAMCPTIANLYTDNAERLARKTREIPQELWSYVEELGKTYIRKHPGQARNGLGFCFKDAVAIETLKPHNRAKFD